MFSVPFFSSDDDDNEPLHVGDSVRIKSDVPGLMGGGQRGTLERIDRETDSYLVKFADGQTIAYDRDMIRKAL